MVSSKVGLKTFIKVNSSDPHMVLFVILDLPLALVFTADTNPFLQS
jgi:hypothetical protein